MNVLVTGANGQLGNEMRIVANRSQNDYYFFSDITEQEGTQTVHLDITDKDTVQNWVKDNDIKLIINCAAYTNVDMAESDYQTAELLNATAVSYLADAIKQVNGTLIHISTDYVFGGSNSRTPCAEEENASPTSVYGLTKLHGERAIIESGCNYIIIRTAWLYSEYGKNFVKTMMNLTSTREELKVVFDQVGTPTYASDLAETIFEIIENRKFDKQGIYHYSNEGVCSWFDFAVKIAEFAGNTKCKIKPCLSHEFPSPVTRPSYSVLNKTKIKDTFEIEIPYWTDSLKKCINNLLYN
jgi:dTDP-4-dehydrorhamnose reductase